MMPHRGPAAINPTAAGGAHLQEEQHRCSCGASGEEAEGQPGHHSPRGSACWRRWLPPGAAPGTSSASSSRGQARSCGSGRCTSAFSWNLLPVELPLCCCLAPCTSTFAVAAYCPVKQACHPLILPLVPVVLACGCV